MGLKLYMLVLVAIAATRGYSQDTLTSGLVEQRSYQLYLDKDWAGLIDFGNTSVSKGFDYYYLRLRLGIAYYEKKNYIAALPQFQKALTFNSGDELCQEYIYYCYLFTGRYDEARWYSKQFNESLKDKIGILNQRGVSVVILEGGTKITDKKTYAGQNPNDSKGNYFNPAVYAQIGLSHYIKNRFSLFHAATYFNQKTFINKVSQFQYFLKANIPLKQDFSVSATVHYINIGVSSESTYSITDTLWPPGVPPHTQPPPGAPPFKIITTHTTVSNNSNENYAVANVNVQKQMGYVGAGLGLTLSNMYNKTQYINSGYISCAPLGNSKLVIGATAYLHTTDAYKLTYVAASPFIYLQPLSRLGIKLNYLYNTANNFIEDNGYVINNSPDLTYSRYSALVNVLVNRHLVMYGLYQLEFKKENVQQFNYKYNVIVAGIKIIP